MIQTVLPGANIFAQIIRLPTVIGVTSNPDPVERAWEQGNLGL